MRANSTWNFLKPIVTGRKMSVTTKPFVTGKREARYKNVV